MTTKNKQKKENLYLGASKLALENSNLINEEANLLNDNGHHARGFALSIISLEESAKAFLFRLISLSIVDEHKTMKFVYNHENKLLQSSRILGFGLELAEVIFNSMKIAETEGKIQNIPTLDNYIKNIKLWKEIFDKIEKFFHDMKLDSIYVGVRDGIIINPNTNFKKGSTSDIISMADMQIKLIKTLVDLENSQFLAVWKEPISSRLKIDHLFSNNKTNVKNDKAVIEKE